MTIRTVPPKRPRANRNSGGRSTPPAKSTTELATDSAETPDLDEAAKKVAESYVDFWEALKASKAHTEAFQKDIKELRVLRSSLKRCHGKLSAFLHISETGQNKTPGGGELTLEQEQQRRATQILRLSKAKYGAEDAPDIHAQVYKDELLSLACLLRETSDHADIAAYLLSKRLPRLGRRYVNHEHQHLIRCSAVAYHQATGRQPGKNTSDMGPFGRFVEIVRSRIPQRMKPRQPSPSTILRHVKPHLQAHMLRSDQVKPRRSKT